MKIQQNDKISKKIKQKKQGGKSEKTSPKWGNFHKSTPNMPLAVNWKSKSAVKFEKKQSTKQKSGKNKPKKQANFIYNKPKNKQPASLHKNPQLHKKTSPISRENRKVDITADFAFAGKVMGNHWCNS